MVSATNFPFSHHRHRRFIKCTAAPGKKFAIDFELYDIRNQIYSLQIIWDLIVFHVSEPI